MSTDTTTLLQVQDLKKHFPITQGIIFMREVGSVKAVDGVSFDVKRGETLGLVGESGCGKSTTGRTILQLHRATAGKVFFTAADNQTHDLTSLKGEPLRKMRRKMQMIFQDPYASLNPRMTVGDIIGEPLIIHGVARGKEVQERVEELLKVVGLNSLFCQSLPARVFRRAAAAHRRGARPGAAARVHRLRRADQRAGRFDPGAGGQSAGGFAGAVQSDLPVHCP